MTIDLLATAFCLASNLIVEFFPNILLKLNYLVSTKKNIISKLTLIVLTTTLPLQSFATVNNNINSPYSEKKLVKVDKESTYQSSPTTAKYILGAGDRIYIKFIRLPEFSKIYYIGATGEIILPELGHIYVEGLSIQGFIKKLEDLYSDYIISPIFEIQIAGYRPVNVNLVGEVRSPGRYTISGPRDQSNAFSQREPSNLLDIRTLSSASNNLNNLNRLTSFPTLFEAIKASGGITPYSDLTNIKVIRKNAIDLGGGYVTTNLNILPEISGENLTDSQNIKIMDGDIIRISKSDTLITEQMMMSMRNNINPSEIMIFISGQSNTLGRQIVPNGSSLNQAIASAGGKRIFSGNIEFYRFKVDGTVSKRKFRHKPDAKQGDYRNPMLIDGDIINIARSPIGYATDAISTISAPIFGLYGLTNLIETIIENN